MRAQTEVAKSKPVSAIAIAHKVGFDFFESLICTPSDKERDDESQEVREAPTIREVNSSC